MIVLRAIFCVIILDGVFATELIAFKAIQFSSFLFPFAGIVNPLTIVHPVVFIHFIIPYIQ